MRDDESKDSLGVMASQFLTEGLRKKSRKHIEGYKKNLGRGALEQAHEDFTRAIKDSSTAAINEPSPFLTEQENAELIRLNNKRLKVRSDGKTVFNILDKNDQARLNFLWGKDKEGREANS